MTTHDDTSSFAISDQLFHQMPQGVVVHDETGRITRWNQAALDILGLSADQLRGRDSMDPAWKTIREDGTPFEGSRHPAALTGQDGIPRRNVIMGVNEGTSGLHRWISIDSIPLLDEDGRQIGVYAIFNDITELKDMELRYQAERDRFDLAIDGIDDGLWDWNIQEGTTYFSPRWKSMLGYRDKEIDNTFDAWESIIHPEDMKRVRQALDKHFKRGIPYDVEVRLKTKSGDYRWIQARGKALLDKDGTPIRMLGFHTDIHDKKMLEANYHRELRFSQTIIDHAGSIVVVIDTEGTITRINASIEQVTGYTRDEVIGRNIFETFFLEAERGLFKDQLACMTPRDFPKKYNSTWIKKDGGHISLACATSCITDEDGEITHIVAMGIDITKQEAMRKELEEYKSVLEKKVETELNKRLQKEEELDQQENLLIQQSKMAEMGEMIGAIAHQLKQPINGISLLAQVLPEEIELGEMDYVHRSLDDIVKYADFMGDTITEFRNFFRQDVKPEPFALSDSIDSTGKILGYELKTAGITLQNRVDPELSLIGHHNKFKQVILNLVNNAKDAIKETGKEKGLIEISAESTPDSIVLYVDDNGGGIPDSIVKKIFEPYFTTKPSEVGTGIGLQITRTIVEKHFGGRIDVASEGEKTRFTLRFPRLHPST